MAQYGYLALMSTGKQWIFACTTCNRTLQDAIFNSTFYPNLFVMLLAFIVLAVVVTVLAFFSTRREKKRAVEGMPTLTAVPLIAASTTIGIGIGGFIDGTFLHQILQWHEMLSNKIPVTTIVGKSINMFWDGIFHAFCFIVVVIGVQRLFILHSRKGILWSPYLFVGGLLGGWGLFNMVEGIIDHHILRLHNVVENSVNHDIGNYTFLGFSLILILISWLLIRKGSKKNRHEINGR